MTESAIMSPEEEALGDLFLGVLPALRLHLQHQLTDCLCCGNKVSTSDLLERVQLAEQYVNMARDSRLNRRQSLEVIRGQEDAVLLAWGWSESQLQRMLPEVRKKILCDNLQAGQYSVRKDGSLFHVQR